MSVMNIISDLCALWICFLWPIVHSKIIFAQCAHTQAIQDVDEFVSSSEQILRNVALHQCLSNGSSAVNGCRQNESPNS